MRSVVPHRAWCWYLVLGLAAALVAVLLHGYPGSLAFSAVQLSGAGAALVGRYRHRPAAAGAWRMIAIGLGLAAAADAGWVLAGRMRD